MAYCRFSNGDVYLYADGRNLVCCACRLAPMEIQIGGTYWYGDTRFHVNRGCQITARKAVIAHLYEHKSAGHKVGRGALTRLRREIKLEQNRVPLRRQRKGR